MQDPITFHEQIRKAVASVLMSLVDNINDSIWEASQEDVITLDARDDLFKRIDNDLKNSLKSIQWSKM